ncbi:carboxypeptidase M32 [Deminuibacter soli]|uniref:Metal-dependent carboxypeptidase n=1 Tax=Deminuibacter soli TaxID=2291815 RepID=A0A3E1NDI8_9BACT|nr:carboxypeptidase M32 [Deminuibacter soli]RFM26053.1 carboxypeptidase M32 [Deminuibacter soli]
MLTQQSTNDLYNDFCERMRRVADIKYAAAVLQWDQETYMPAQGADGRARQLATLSEIAHAHSTDAQLVNLVKELQGRGDLDAKQQRNVALTAEDIEKQQKFSNAFVRQLSEAVSKAFNAWIAARRENSFSHFSGALGELVVLKKQEADLLGYEAHPYNALVKDYEKSMDVGKLDAVFTAITGPLQQIMAQIAQQPQPDESFLHRFYPKQKQWDWGMYLVKELGFDLQSGRQDISEHPFTTNFSAKDVRITTRIDEQDFANMTWSCIHEAGHALYEQGLPDADYGLPSGEYASLSIHESQSRLWENSVGRGIDFWQHYYPVLQGYFPEALAGIELPHFYKAINKVKPSLIRTEADEITYHFHVKVRYQLEKELIGGEVAVQDIPARWNQLYHDNLGVTVPDDKNGCLQDVHWSHGSFGYFPTYSLGSFYASQFWAKANEQLPQLKEQLRSGNSQPLLQWLRKHIHAEGRLLESEDLCRKVTGEPLNINYFITYLKSKYTP